MSDEHPAIPEVEPGDPGHTVVEPVDPGHTVVEPDDPGHTVVEPGDPGHTVVEPGEERARVETPDHDTSGLELALEVARAAARSGDPARRRTAPKARLTPTDSRRGRPRISGAHPDDRDPQTLSSLVGRMVDAHGWEVGLQVQGVFGRWAEIVGADIAAHCTPESLTDGHLKVRTDSTAWATQLRLLAPQLIRRLNQELGHNTIQIIDVEGPTAPSWSKGKRRVKGRGPRDTYG